MRIIRLRAGSDCWNGFGEFTISDVLLITLQILEFGDLFYERLYDSRFNAVLFISFSGSKMIVSREVAIISNFPLQINT